MLRRKALERFRFWKKNKSKQALLVTGARQVGKTFLIREFLRVAYSSFVEFNLVDDDSARKTLANAENASDLMLRISVIADVPLVPHETAIFFDEIQECPSIMRHIKQLIDAQEYDFILSGSLLGVTLEGVDTLPGGYVTEVTMYPLDFEEFCWANGVASGVMTAVRQSFERTTEVPDFIHERLFTLWHRYLLIGGMPDAVRAYLDSGTIDQTRVVHSDIRKLYKRDISQYAPKAERAVIQNIYDLIPSEITGSSRRFKLSSIEEVKRFSQVTNEFLWLKAANVALPTYAVTCPASPLLLTQKDNIFKLFMSDVGLLTSTFIKRGAADLLDGKAGMNLGGVYENAVAQELAAHEFDLRYYNGKKVGELDFVVETFDRRVIAFEVKSGNAYKTHTALDRALGKDGFGIDEAYVLAETNVERDGAVTYLPAYMVSMFHNQ